MELTTFIKKYSSPKRPAGTPWSSANGVYVVSPACPTEFWEGERCGTNVPRNVKIGKASGEFGFADARNKGRLPLYRTYWPNGVTVHAVLTTPSFDRTVHTIEDQALKRETTLRRIFHNRGLTGFGSNGQGGDNGTGHLGSEWIHLTPSEIMNYLIAVGPIRHAHDHVYGCTKQKCQLVNIDKVSRNVSRLSGIVKSLEYVLEDEKKHKKLGVKGRPVVLPRTILEADKNPNHDLHAYSHLLKSNVNMEYERSKRRIADAQQKKANEADRKLNNQRLTRVKRQVRRKRVAAMRKAEPRNVAAIRPSFGMDVAMARADAKKRPGGVRKRPERFVPGSSQDRPPTVRDRKAAAKPRDDQNRDAQSTLKRHPHHRRHYNVKKRAVARALFGGLDPNSSPKSPTDSPNDSPQSCPRALTKSDVLYHYANYTYFDVTGDGRCYFYAIVKALGLPLYQGVGRKGDLDRFFDDHNYFDSTKRRYWMAHTKSAAYHDPIDVLHDSAKMAKMLRRRRDIVYVAKLVRTRNDRSQVDAYMMDPIAQVRQAKSDGIYHINTEGAVTLIPGLTARLRKNRDEEKSAAFKAAFRDGRVVTFVWRNVPGMAPHYEVIIPNRLVQV